MPILKTKNLTKSYKTKKGIVHAVTDVNLSVEKGEFVAIMGQSGSGKSTLIQLMGGLDTPTSGEILVDEIDITKLKDNQLSKFRGKKFGFVFQTFYLQPFLTVAQNISLPSMFTNSQNLSLDRTRKLASILKIEDKLDSYPSEISGGQTQRVAILRSLYNNPAIIFADEPTGNLDETNSIAVLKMLKSINQKLGTTIIMVTHDSRVKQYATRTITLQEGKIT
ncbi:ABC transporter ATP-binding protein [Candidatus Saccharibacteria bacterium]|nr:ABC transporter ATP-binding protein [Candidatus Saccharibacteria bacterium]